MSHLRSERAISHNNDYKHTHQTLTVCIYKDGGTAKLSCSRSYEKKSKQINKLKITEKHIFTRCVF
jgi:hypothetical protein